MGGEASRRDAPARRARRTSICRAPPSNPNPRWLSHAGKLLGSDVMPRQPPAAEPANRPSAVPYDRAYERTRRAGINILLHPDLYGPP